MCGIIGEYNFEKTEADFIARRDKMHHRGPDSSGFIKFKDGKLKLGHSRLSVLDLSDKASQPLTIGNHTIIYNGEVYNFNDIKKELNIKTSSNSDTEVILRGYIKHGVNIFSKLDGMFSLAIYDNESNKLILARDRFGIKPFYFYRDGDKFSFASEIKSLACDRVINMKAVQAFLYQNYIYTEDEIFNNVKSFPAGNYGILNFNDNSFDLFKYHQHYDEKKISDINKAKTEFLSIMKKSVADSLVSDVPVGVFLSAGNDSSLIASIAKEIKPDLKTFTIGFDDPSFDESIRAEKISKIIGSDHYTFKLDKDEIIKSIPNILDSFDMPFGDSSALPFYFLSKYSRDYAKVCLSGDGADELFGGYPLYYLPPIASLYKMIPFKFFLENIINKKSTSLNKMSFEYKAKQFIRGAKYDYKKAHFVYRSMDNNGILKNGYSELDNFNSFFEEFKSYDIKDQLMHVDQKTVLEKDYLIKVDRMSMAHGLEVRVPFLNNNVSDFSNRLSSNLKVRKTTTKYLLKKTLEDYLPKDLIYGKKEGFSFPIGLWLCGELKDFMLDTLSAENIAKIDFLEYSKVQELISDHLAKNKDYNRELWGLISLVRFINNSL